MILYRTAVQVEICGKTSASGTTGHWYTDKPSFILWGSKDSASCKLANLWIYETDVFQFVAHEFCSTKHVLSNVQNGCKGQQHFIHT